jgi:hypothetical protein
MFLIGSIQARARDVTMGVLITLILLAQITPGLHSTPSFISRRTLGSIPPCEWDTSMRNGPIDQQQAVFLPHAIGAKLPPGYSKPEWAFDGFPNGSAVSDLPRVFHMRPGLARWALTF